LRVLAASVQQAYSEEESEQNCQALRAEHDAQTQSHTDGDALDLSAVEVREHFLKLAVQ
jgi:hypothetical protein